MAALTRPHLHIKIYIMHIAHKMFWQPQHKKKSSHMRHWCDILWTFGAHMKENCTFLIELLKSPKASASPTR